MNNQNWGSALSKKQNYGGAIQPYIVYWTALNLKGEYASYKIVIKIFIFVEFGTVLLHSENIGQCQIQHFHFSRYPISGGNVLWNFEFITSEINLVNYLKSSTIIKMSHWSFSHNIFIFTLTINWSSGTSNMLQLFSTALFNSNFLLLS